MIDREGGNDETVLVQHHAFLHRARFEPPQFRGQQISAVMTGAVAVVESVGPVQAGYDRLYAAGSDDLQRLRPARHP